MSLTLSLTTSLTGEGWRLQGSISVPEGSGIPPAVFVYENLGTPSRGPFHSVVVARDMASIPVWSGIVIPTKRASFLRYLDLDVVLPSDRDLDGTVQALVSSLQSFSREFADIRQTTVTYVLE